MKTIVVAALIGLVCVAGASAKQPPITQNVAALALKETRANITAAGQQGKVVLTHVTCVVTPRADIFRCSFFFKDLSKPICRQTYVHYVTGLNHKYDTWLRPWGCNETPFPLNQVPVYPKSVRSSA